MIIRVDDVSVNTDLTKLNKMVELIRELCDAEIWFVISLIAFDMNGVDKEQCFPPILNICSDKIKFYKGTKLGHPDLNLMYPEKLVSHGFIHVDHRLLGFDLQEWNIVQSCNIICRNNKVFVPPNHKYNEDTEIICARHGIELVKVEEGWNHLVYSNHLNPDENYYFHTFDYTLLELRSRLEKR